MLKGLRLKVWAKSAKFETLKSVIRLDLKFEFGGH